jgi:hypothetical protein
MRSALVLISLLLAITAASAQASTETITLVSIKVVQPDPPEAIVPEVAPATIRSIPIIQHPPLDQRVSIRLKDASLQTFFEEISRQTKLEFILVQGLADCRVAAFLHGRTIREALQLLLETGNLTYQQLGRSNSYTVTSRHEIRLCPPGPRKPAGGRCFSKGAPISLECKGAKLSEFAEILHDQSGASLMVWNDAINESIDVDLDKMNFETALDGARKNKTLKIKMGIKKNYATFTLFPPNDMAEPWNLRISTRVVKITRNGTEEL